MFSLPFLCFGLRRLRFFLKKLFVFFFANTPLQCTLFSMIPLKLTTFIIGFLAKTYERNGWKMNNCERFRVSPCAVVIVHILNLLKSAAHLGSTGGKKKNSFYLVITAVLQDLGVTERKSPAHLCAYSIMM